MDIPKEILVVPLKEKKPIIKNKKKFIKYVVAILITSGWLIYLIYYPAPTQFSFKNAVPIAIMCTLIFSTVLSISYLVMPFKKALLCATIITATVSLKKSPIITIVAYAICLPLLLLKPLQERHQ